jgi:hypothetical protein
MPSTTACKVLDDPGIVPSRALVSINDYLQFNLHVQALSSKPSFVHCELAKQCQAAFAQRRTIVATSHTKFHLSEACRRFLKDSIGQLNEIEGLPASLKSAVPILRSGEAREKRSKRKVESQDFMAGSSPSKASF